MDGLRRALIEAAREGDGLAFAGLYEWRARAVAGYLRANRLPPSRCASIVERVFLRLWRELPSTRLEDEAALDLWLLRAAHEAAATDEGRAALPPRYGSALAGLPDSHREALSLHYLFGLSRAETASALQAPAATVAGWLRHGLEDLAEAA